MTTLWFYMERKVLFLEDKTYDKISADDVTLILTNNVFFVGIPNVIFRYHNISQYRCYTLSRKRLSMTHQVGGAFVK